MRVHIVLPDDIVRAIDEMAGKRGRSRYIAEAVTSVAKRDRLLKVLRETAGTLDISRHPEWATDEGVAKWIRDLREAPSLRHDPIEDVVVRVPAGRKRRNQLAKGQVKSR
jgi:predicted transcriptional regulator